MTTKTHEITANRHKLAKKDTKAATQKMQNFQREKLKIHKG